MVNNKEKSLTFFFSGFFIRFNFDIFFDIIGIKGREVVEQIRNKS